MFKSIITAILVSVISSTAALATEWSAWDTSAAATSLTQAYLANEDANKFHLGNDDQIVALAQEAAYKERNLIFNTHIGASNYTDLVSANGYDLVAEDSATRYNYYYYDFDGNAYSAGTLYSNDYVSVKERLVNFFTARNENLNTIQQYNLDNNDSYSNNGVNWSNF